jgi:RimJ/RimL family protein N-acetyltransferase
VLSAPPAQADFIEQAIRGFSPDEVFSVEWLRRVFSRDAERIVGPAEVNYADNTTFRSHAHESTRAISTADSALYEKLAASLDPKEIEDSGFSGDVLPAFGAFSDGILCAAAYYRIWEPSIAHITVATHPAYRRRGFAAAAVGALAADAFERGLILQWRAVAWNRNSLALARNLGFRYYCSTIYVRLRDPQRG